MVEISVVSGDAVFEIQGLDKLWSLKSRLQIPLRHIRGVHGDTQVARGWWHGFKLPGTSVPGILTAGTFYQDGKRVFWDVHDPDKTIVIELHDERYDELIIEVADPAAAIATLRGGIR